MDIRHRQNFSPQPSARRVHEKESRPWAGELQQRRWYFVGQEAERARQQLCGSESGRIMTGKCLERHLIDARKRQMATNDTVIAGQSLAMENARALQGNRAFHGTGDLLFVFACLVQRTLSPWCHQGPICPC